MSGNSDNDILADEDLQAALKELKTYVDITESDLKEIYVLAVKHAEKRLAAQVKVGEAMTESVITVKPETDIRELVSLLSANNVSGLPVVDEAGHVLGIVTESDVLASESSPYLSSITETGEEHPFSKLLERFHGKHAGRPKKGSSAGELMTSPAITVGPDEGLREAARLLARHSIKRLPVVDGEQALVGIISKADIVKTMGN